MKTTLTRLFTVALLMIISIAAGAVDVKIVNDGVFKEGNVTIGTVTYTQEEQKDGKVLVTLFATPSKGYTIKRDDIVISLTYDPSAAAKKGTRADEPKIVETFNPDGPKETIAYPNSGKYTVTVDPNLGVWVQTVVFTESNRDTKEPGDSDPDYSGIYYIANGKQLESTNNQLYYDKDNPSVNFYLCPAQYYFNPEGSGTNLVSTTDDTGKPFLTTYKTNQDDNSIWIIEQVENKNTYYIKHIGDGNEPDKYLIKNESLKTLGLKNSNVNDTRLRVHLEEKEKSDLDTDAEFEIIQYGSDDNIYYGIRISTIDKGWLNPSKGNKQDYKPNGTDYIGGIIGYYADKAPNETGGEGSKWYLEKVPPTISYNSSNLIEISYTDASYTIYYSYGEESTPSPSSEGTFNYSETGPFDPPSGTTTIKAIAIKGDIESGVATFTPTFLLGSTHKYLIQSQSNVYFYMIPGDDEGEDPNKITKVNTTTLFRPTMEWYFKNAGVEDGVQYYYIVNRGNNKNLCYDTENTAYGVYMETNSDNSNKFKFQIVESPTAGTYNIIPYGVTADKKYLNKSSGNESADAIILWSDATQGNNRWKFVPSADLDKTAPFNVSNTSSTPYYKIASVGSSGYYIVPPSGTATNVTTLNPTTLNPADPEVEKTMNWYFEVAQAATVTDWCTYYHIRNVLTDEYLYFAKDDNNADACLEMKSTIETGEEDRYMFTWARTATANTYYIVPKKVKDKSLNQISSLQRDNATLKSNLTRAVGNFAWTFAPSYCCLNPTIEYVPGAETGTVSMTCATKPSKIYYTTDGSNPASSTTRLVYDSEHKPSYTDIAQIYFKAIAVLDDSEHEAASEVITYIRNPKVTFDPEYDYEYNNSAKEPPVTSVAVVIDETTSISVEDTEYDVTYGANINVGSVTVTIGDAMDNNLFISGTATFNILPRSLGDGTTAADGILIAVTRTGEDTYTLTIKNGSLTLEENTDYSLSDVTADASGYRATITAVENSNYIGGAKVIYVKADFPTATGGNSGGPAAVYQASMDLAYPSDMKAYIVTGIDYSAATVTVQELAYIPNGVPILLLTNDGSGHDADFTASAYTVVEEADVSANLLRKSEGGESVDWGQYFIFSRGEFVLSMGEKTMKAGKFYFDNDKYSSGGASTRALSIRCGTKDVASAINGVVSQSDKELKSPIWYTLEGQKLAQKPTRRGIYIQNGKIIIIK